MSSDDIWYFVAEKKQPPHWKPCIGIDGRSGSDGIILSLSECYDQNYPG